MNLFIKFNNNSILLFIYFFSHFIGFFVVEVNLEEKFFVGLT